MPSRDNLIKVIGSIPENPENVRTVRQLADAALQRYDAAQSADKDSAAQEIVNLGQIASTLVAQSSEPHQRAWTSGIRVGVASVIVVFIALVVGTGYYMRGVGAEALQTIEGTRPILVIAVIVSTIVFGGSLLIGSLFSSDGTFEERFRRAREIFLVFSGIFATVLGFYFGATAANQGAPIPAVVTQTAVTDLAGAAVTTTPSVRTAVPTRGTDGPTATP